MPDITPGHIEDVRTAGSTLIKQLYDIEKGLKPPAVQEVVLARRDIESARDRLRRASMVMQEIDPDTDKVDNRVY